MLTIVICVLAFIGAFWATKRSVGAGLIAVAAVGYFYGILRANLLTATSHFIFDASLTGLYLAYGSHFFTKTDHTNSKLRLWAALLIIWPCMICFLPFQTLMVSIVGLRGNIFFLPSLIIGSGLLRSDVRKFTLGLAVLNVAALAFGIAEYFRGIEPFYPISPVTDIIYNSADVAGGAHRIPALFTSAHAYAGTMVATIPFLFGAWTQEQMGGRNKLILLLGMVAAFLGILLASTRSNFVIAVYLITIAIFAGKFSARQRILFGLVIALLAGVALTNERFQRFKSLGDSEMVMDRIAGSVNRSFFELLSEYPMGNGLGGGGTSMPYFLAGQVQRPVAIESEWARILAEQGIIGLFLWMGFVGWCITRRTAFIKDPWLGSRRLIWFWYSLNFVMASLGVGLLTGIPNSFFFLVAVGWAVAAPAKEAQMYAPIRTQKGKSTVRLQPIYGR